MRSSRSEMLTINEKGNRRLLFPDGTTIVDEWDKAKEILRGEVLETKCISGYETDRYMEIYRVDLAADVDNIVDPIYDDHSHSDEELDRLLQLVETSSRWNEKYVDRVEEELLYYIESKNVRFLLLTYDLVRKLKETTVVGVGRGSASASLVLYLLHVHDIDPMQYKIDFVELSKVENDGR